MSDLATRLKNRLVNCENYGKSVWMTDRETTLYEDIDEAAARIEQLEATLQEAITRMTEAARDAGHWKGKYEAAGYPGTLDGWIEKAKALEAENERLREALHWYQKTVGDCRKITPEGDSARYDLHQDCGDRASAALAGKAGE